MPTARRRATGLALATATMLVLAAAPAAEAAKSCGTTKASFGSSGRTYTLSVRVHRGSVSCATAKRIVKRGFFGRGYPGWMCFEARPATTYSVACAPRDQDPDTASRVVRAKIKR